MLPCSIQAKIETRIFNSSEVYSVLLGCTFSNPRTSKIQKSTQKWQFLLVFTVYIEGPDVGFMGGSIYNQYMYVHVNSGYRSNSERISSPGRILNLLPRSPSV